MILTFSDDFLKSGWQDRYLNGNRNYVFRIEFGKNIFGVSAWDNTLGWGSDGFSIYQYPCDIKGEMAVDAKFFCDLHVKSSTEIVGYVDIYGLKTS